MVEYARMRFRSVSTHGAVRSADHRQRAGDRDRVGPQGCAADEWRHPRDQVHAGFDHRRRVQIRTDGRRGLHRIREPEMKRELRGLGERGEQDQSDDTDVRRVTDEVDAAAEHLRTGSWSRRLARARCRRPAEQGHRPP